MSKKLLYGCLFCLLAFATPIKAQLSVSFLPAIYGQSLEGLSFAQIINNTQLYVEIGVTVNIKETNGTDVAVIKLPPFWVTQGLNKIDRVAFANSRFVFANTGAGTVLRQSGRLPEGEYEYCFELEILNSKGGVTRGSFEQCFINNVRALTPLLLISPVDEDKLCNKRPDFIWQPPLPLPPNAKFRLLLAEVKEKQDIVEAVAYNQPIINQANLRTNNLFFPVNIPNLKEGHTYAWQVTVYVDQTILKKSEVWSFTVKCNETVTLTPGESYRELKEYDDGNYYIAHDYLRFSFNNSYNEGMLNYSIECISDPDIKVRTLPRIPLRTGLNKYELDLNEITSMRLDKEYLLIVRSGTKQLRLRFIYKYENAK